MLPDTIKFFGTEFAKIEVNYDVANHNYLFSSWELTYSFVEKLIHKVRSADEAYFIRIDKSGRIHCGDFIDDHIIAVKDTFGDAYRASNVNAKFATVQSKWSLIRKRIIACITDQFLNDYETDLVTSDDNFFHFTSLEGDMNKCGESGTLYRLESRRTKVDEVYHIHYVLKNKATKDPNNENNKEEIVLDAEEDSFISSYPSSAGKLHIKQISEKLNSLVNLMSSLREAVNNSEKEPDYTSLFYTLINNSTTILMSCVGEQVPNNHEDRGKDDNLNVIRTRHAIALEQDVTCDCSAEGTVCLYCFLKSLV